MNTKKGFHILRVGLIIEFNENIEWNRFNGQHPGFKFLQVKANCRIFACS